MVFTVGRVFVSCLSLADLRFVSCFVSCFISCFISCFVSWLIFAFAFFSNSFAALFRSSITLGSWALSLFWSPVLARRYAPANSSRRAGPQTLVRHSLNLSLRFFRRSSSWIVLKVLTLLDFCLSDWGLVSTGLPSCGFYSGFELGPAFFAVRWSSELFVS